ncbi:MAG TPA: diacylglycerol kinase family protein, partial [Patescibacteria group bacterium]|nr:diacylglycerol kinase family protein [Patescibacteria group bacterium]
AGLVTKADVGRVVENKLIESGYKPLTLILDFNFEANVAQVDLADIGLVVAVGGDGTVKVAAREIITRHLKAPLLIIPFGSANVLATALKIPIGLKESLALLDSFKTMKIDVGLLNHERYFLVGFSLGYVSSIIINTHRELKNKFGSIGYIFRIFWNRIRIPRIKFRIETQNRVFWLKGNSLFILNAFSFYGFAPKKSVNINDGVLNLYVITNKTFWTMVKAAIGVIFYTRPPKYVFTLDNKYFKIRLKKKKFLKTAQIDGDHVKLSRNIEIEVLPQALEVFIK